MSAFSTLFVSRKGAEELVSRCRERSENRVQDLTDEELDHELNGFVYSENYTDILGTLYNYQITHP